MKLKSVGCIVSLAFMACGITEPKYKDYADNIKEIDPGIVSCAAGLTGYEQNISSIVDGTCSSCHRRQKIANGNLVKGDANNNRLVLLSYDLGDGTKLFAKISDADRHDGGDQSKTLTMEKLGAWKATEDQCTSN